MCIRDRYKDQPVNETFHCAALIYLLAQPTCNILENLDSGYVNDFWTLCIDLMLSLDPSQHAKLIEEMDIRLNRGPFDFKDKAAKALLLKLMLKSAVTAEVFRPFDPTKPWTTSVNKLSVVASKGDQKVLLEEMTKYLNETSTPLVRVLLRTMTNVQPLSDQLKLNMNGWKEQLDKLTPAQ